MMIEINTIECFRKMSPHKRGQHKKYNPIMELKHGLHFEKVVSHACAKKFLINVNNAHLQAL